MVQNYRWVSKSDLVKLDKEFGNSVTVTVSGNIAAGGGPEIVAYPVELPTYNKKTKTGTTVMNFDLTATGTKLGFVYKGAESVLVNKSAEFQAYVNDNSTLKRATDLESSATAAIIFIKAESSNENLFSLADLAVTPTGADGTPTIAGTIRGVANGTGTINITGVYLAAGGEKKTITLQVPVTVGSGSEPVASGLKFSSTSYDVKVGGTTSAVATPSNLTGGTLTYESANTKIATISVTGVVSGVAEGSTTITATYKVDGETYTATATVKVTKDAPKASVTLDKSTYSVNSGTTVTAKATVSAGTTGTPEFSIADTTVATVDKTTGVITGVSAGTTTLTVTVGAVKATAAVVVTSTKVVLDKDTYTVVVGKSVQATATSSAGTPVYSVADKTIATVDSATGLIKGVKAGTTTLYAQVGTAKTAAVIVVTEDTPEPTPEPEPTIPSVPEFDYIDGSFTLNNNGTAAYLGSIKNSGTVTVPSYITYKYGTKTYTYKVTRIADYAFSKSKVKKVKIPATVTQIGYKAFFKCPNLEKVAFADASNIDDIEDKAFKKTREGCILKQKNGEKFDSDLKSWLEKTFKQIVIK